MRIFVLFIALVAAGAVRGDDLTSLLARVPPGADALIVLRGSFAELAAGLPGAGLAPAACGRVLAEQLELLRKDTGVGLADPITLVAAGTAANGQVFLAGRLRVDTAVLARALQAIPEARALAPKETPEGLELAGGTCFIQTDGSFCAGAPDAVRAGCKLARDAGVTNPNAKVFVERFGAGASFGIVGPGAALPAARVKSASLGFTEQGLALTLECENAEGANALKTAALGLLDQGEATLKARLEAAVTASAKRGVLAALDPELIQARVAVEDLKLARAALGLEVKGNTLAVLVPRDRLPLSPPALTLSTAVGAAAALNWLNKRTPAPAAQNPPLTGPSAQPVKSNQDR